MPVKLDDYLSKLPEERQQAINACTAGLIAEEATLRQIREAIERSREDLAKMLHLKQAAVSKFEQRTDLYINTLRNYIEAMGGKLEVVARFPNQAIHINQFEKLDS